MTPFAGLIVMSALLQVPPPGAPAQLAAGLRSRFARILEDEADGLTRIVERLERAGETGQAARVRSLIQRPESGDGPSRFVPLREIDLGSPQAEEVDAKTDPARALRDETAEALFALATQAAAGQPPSLSLADECLRAVLARQPGHAEARRILGFLPHRDGWATPFAIQQIESGKVPHPTYGWVEAAWVPRLERGELPAPNGTDRWLPAAEADALRRRWEDAWRITTEHFQLQANVPLDQAIAFARLIEALDELFFARFADLIGPELPLAQRFRNPKLLPKVGTKRFRIHYYATRQDYLDALVPRHGRGIEGSIGFYLPPGDARKLGVVPTSSFFRDEGGDLPVTATLFHEASHQLLFESAGPAGYERNDGQFWVFEGLGTYFETMNVRTDGSIEIGGPVGARLQEARRRLVDQKELIPTRRFVAMGRDRFNDESGVHLHYQQAMALTTYLMQHQGGEYRDAYLDYVRDAYRGRLRRGGGRSLEDRLGVSYERLDEELVTYLRTQVAAPEAP